ncbi:MAG: plasmid mobilization relaxosome protein MobC [Bacteriovoracia bacterium]
MTDEKMENELMDLRKLRRTRPAVYLRFSDREFQRLMKDSLTTGRSLQQLLRESYFDRPPTSVLFHREDALQWFKELHRIGVNLNQVARSLNGGFREGFEDTLVQIRNDLNRIKDMVVSRSGAA